MTDENQIMHQDGVRGKVHMRTAAYRRMDVSGEVSVCVRVRACVCVFVCVRACVRGACFLWCGTLRYSVFQ